MTLVTIEIEKHWGKNENWCSIKYNLAWNETATIRGILTFRGKDAISCPEAARIILETEVSKKYDCLTEGVKSEYIENPVILQRKIEYFRPRKVLEVKGA